MLPIEFKEQNVVYAKDQPEYIPLPAYQDETLSISCWKMSWKERVKIFFTGKLWLTQLNFGGPLQPQRPSIESPFGDLPPRR